MSSFEVTLAYFWQFASHWKNGEQSKLTLLCEAGKLHIEFNVSLDHPDNQHAKPTKKASPSQLRRQERRHPGNTKNINLENEPTSKNNLKTENISMYFPCNYCNHRFNSKLELKEHNSRKHQIL